MRSRPKSRTESSPTRTTTRSPLRNPPRNFLQEEKVGFGRPEREVIIRDHRGGSLEVKAAAPVQLKRKQAEKYGRAEAGAES